MAVFYEIMTVQNLFAASPFGKGKNVLKDLGSNKNVRASTMARTLKLI